MGHDQGLGMGNPFYQQYLNDERRWLDTAMWQMAGLQNAAIQQQPQEPPVNPVLLLLED